MFQRFREVLRSARPVRRTAVVLFLVAGGTVLADDPPETPKFYDRIDVKRVSIPVRVIGSGGAPVLSLGIDDFEVRVDGVRVTPEAVDWIRAPETGEAALIPGGPQPAGDSPTLSELEPSGRLIVIFFQLDMANVRIGGLMRMAHRAADFIEELHPSDRIAVLTYSSHLDLRVDFTNDHDRLLDAVRPKALFGPVRDPATDEEPSLLTTYDQQAALDAAVPEAGLKVLAEALQDIPGPKSVIFFGWGLGYRTRSHVRMRKQYASVRSMFAESGTAIYSLDITEADWHTLEHGLRKAARETGGFYASTYIHPAAAMNRLNHAISGYYLVTFSSPVDTVGYHKLRFRLTRAKGLIYARDFFED